MVNQYSLAHLTAISCSAPELITHASNGGYDFVSIRMTAVTAEEQLYELVNNRNHLKKTKQLLRATGLGVLDVELIRLGPETEPEEYLPFLEVGAELGARAVITQLPDPDRQRATDRFARLCDLAAPFGLTIDLEFPSWTETHDLKSATDILEAVNKPNAGLLVDTLHFDRSGSSLDDLQKISAEWIHFIHLCDAPEKHPDTVDEIIHTAREGRFFPGEGGLKLQEILHRLPNAPYSLEIPNSKLFGEMGAGEYIRKALETTKSYLKANCIKNIDERITNEAY